MKLDCVSAENVLLNLCTLYVSDLQSFLHKNLLNRKWLVVGFLCDDDAEFGTNIKLAVRFLFCREIVMPYHKRASLLCSFIIATVFLTPFSIRLISQLKDFHQFFVFFCQPYFNFIISRQVRWCSGWRAAHKFFIHLH